MVDRFLGLGSLRFWSDGCRLCPRFTWSWYSRWLLWGRPELFVNNRSLGRWRFLRRLRHGLLGIYRGTDCADKEDKAQPRSSPTKPVLGCPSLIWFCRIRSVYGHRYGVHRTPHRSHSLNAAGPLCLLRTSTIRLTCTPYYLVLEGRTVTAAFQRDSQGSAPESPGRSD